MRSVEAIWGAVSLFLGIAQKFSLSCLNDDVAHGGPRTAGLGDSALVNSGPVLELENPERCKRWLRPCERRWSKECGAGLGEREAQDRTGSVGSS